MEKDIFQPIMFLFMYYRNKAEILKDANDSYMLVHFITLKYHSNYLLNYSKYLMLIYIFWSNSWLNNSKNPRDALTSKIFLSKKT